MRYGRPLLLTILVALLPAVVQARDQAMRRPVELLELVRESLARNPDIRLAEQDILEGIGRVREARGIFDTTVEASAGQAFAATPLPSGGETAGGDLLDRELRSTYGIGVKKLLPSGITVTPTLSFLRTDALTGSEPSSNMTAVTLAVTVPLMRGKGEEVTRAEEFAAAADLEARRLTLVGTSANSVSAVVKAYWDYLAAVRLEEIARLFEEKAEQLIETIQRLVEADERPMVDLVPLRASLATRQVARFSAEREVERARHALADAIGLDPEEVGRIGTPATDFPAMERDELPGDERERLLIERTGDRRADVLALGRAAEEVRTGLAIAKDRLRPKLDVALAGGVDGLSEGGPFAAFLLPAGVDGVGPRVSLSLAYSWPVAGTAGKGALLRKEALYERALTQREEGLRQARMEVAAAMADLRSSARVWETVRVAAAYHLEAVRVGERKLVAGLTTVVDLLNTENDYIAALREEVEARTSFANAIITLRLASGTILAPEPGEQALTLYNLSGIP